MCKIYKSFCQDNKKLFYTNIKYILGGKEMKIISWLIDFGLWLFGTIINLFLWGGFIFLIFTLIAEITGSEKIKKLFDKAGDWLCNIFSIISMPFTFLLSIILAIPVIGWIVGLIIAFFQLVWIIVMFLISGIFHIISLIFKPITNLFSRK